MSPTVPVVARKSPLTNKKVLTKFKKTRVEKLKIDDVIKLGNDYLKKQTSIRFGLSVLSFILSCLFFRRFSASFGELRLHHRKVKNAKKQEAITTFEDGLFEWPELHPAGGAAADPDLDVEVPGQEFGGAPVRLYPEDLEQQVNRTKITATGRPTGKFSFLVIFVSIVTKLQVLALSMLLQLRRIWTDQSLWKRS